jgi:hypothetical protein
VPELHEHVRSLETAIENCRLYLKPGGTMVTQFSGRFSYFAVANQVIPHVVTRKLCRCWPRAAYDIPCVLQQLLVRRRRKGHAQLE